MEEVERKNVNRGYRKLTVWEDAIAYYTATCEAFAGFSFVLQRAASQRLIESLQTKKLTGTWDDSFVIRETNAEYRTDEELGE